VSFTNREGVNIVKPVYRRSVNKQASAKKFGRDTRTVAAANVRSNPMRGGWRL
jgi:hypothetical protein